MRILAKLGSICSTQTKFSPLVDSVRWCRVVVSVPPRRVEWLKICCLVVVIRNRMTTTLVYWLCCSWSASLFRSVPLSLGHGVRLSSDVSDDGVQAWKRKRATMHGQKSVRGGLWVMIGPTTTNYSNLRQHTASSANMCHWKYLPNSEGTNSPNWGEWQLGGQTRLATECISTQWFTNWRAGNVKIVVRRKQMNFCGRELTIVPSTNSSNAWIVYFIAPSAC